MARPQTLQQCLPGLLRIVRAFWPYIRQQRPLIAGSLLALFAGVGLRLLEPWPLKFIFDRVLPAEPAPSGAGIPTVDALDPTLLLTLSAVGVVLIAGLRALADYCSSIGFAMAGTRTLTEVRHDLYRHLQCLSLSFHTRARGGDLTVRVISDVNLLKDATSTAVLPLFANLLILVGMMAFMFWLQWKLALLALAILPLFWLCTARLSRRIQHAAQKQREREGALAATAAESIGAIKTVQALSLESAFVEAFHRRSAKSMGEELKASRLAARLERTVDLLIAIATGLVLWFAAHLVRQQAMTAGDLLVFLTYLKRAFHPLQSLAKHTGRLARATAAGERVLSLLEQAPEVRDRPDAVAAPAFHGAVRFEDVSFGYEPGRRVLDRIDFEVQPGQRVALVGPSGIGKSTLVSLLLRLYDPVEGRVRIDGRDIREYTMASVRSQISVVLQDGLLFAASARDNIAFGAPGATPAEIEAASRLANAHAFIEALPEGYDTLLGERGVTLSGGQRQRIAIARAAVRNAPLLILDEPTIGLDAENERAVVEALERLSRGPTTFLITHNLHLARSADLILYIDQGRVLERGTHAELMESGGRYASLHRMQAAASCRSAQEKPHALAG